MGGHVFISYSRADYEYANALADALIASGVDVWIDRNIARGEIWNSVLAEKVGTCEVFLLVMTPTAGESHYVNEEVNWALNTKRSVVPLLLDGEPMFGVSTIQCQDVRDRQLPGEDLIAEWRLRAPRRTKAVSHAGHVLGPVGMAGLRAALAAIPGLADDEPDDSVGLDALSNLRASLLACGDSSGVTRAISVIDDLSFALHTVLFLRTHLREALSTKNLRRAANDAVKTGVRTGLASEADYVEHVALAFPVNERNCRASMTELVVMLARMSRRDDADPVIQQWVTVSGSAVSANDLINRARAKEAAELLRLVISLEPVTGDWPDRVRTWLLQDRDVRKKAEFECEPTQSGVEEAIGDAIDWGESNAEELDLTLRRLDIAIPAGLMLEWRPEQLAHGLMMLGVDFDVIIRWSERINPDRTMQRIVRTVKKRLGEIGAATERGSGVPPMHWLSKVDLQDIKQLQSQLQSGRFAGALGVAERRSMNTATVRTMLSFSPILMWPDPGDEFPTEHRSVVIEYWESLPGAFVEAYRVGWRGEAAGPLAELRAVWDDEDWLRFIRTIQVGRH